MLHGNVLLISKSHFTRQGLLQALTSDALCIIGEETSAEAALALLHSGNQHVNVIVVDAGSNSGIGDLKAIAEEFPRIFMVVLTDDRDFAYSAAVELNVRALIPATVSAEALKLIVQLVMLDENLFLSFGHTAEATYSLVPLAKNSGDTSAQLSDREAAVLQLIKAGASNKAIARGLNVAEATVKIHVKSVLRKIHVTNRTQAAIWALEHLGQNLGAE